MKVMINENVWMEYGKIKNIDIEKIEWLDKKHTSQFVNRLIETPKDYLWMYDHFIVTGLFKSTKVYATYNTGNGQYNQLESFDWGTQAILKLNTNIYVKVDKKIWKN